MMEGTEREGKRMRARRGGSPAAKKSTAIHFSLANAGRRICEDLIIDNYTDKERERE